MTSDVEHEVAQETEQEFIKSCHALLDWFQQGNGEGELPSLNPAAVERSKEVGISCLEYELLREVLRSLPDTPDTPNALHTPQIRAMLYYSGFSEKVLYKLFPKEKCGQSRAAVFMLLTGMNDDSQVLAPPSTVEPPLPRNGKRIQQPPEGGVTEGRPAVRSWQQKSLWKELMAAVEAPDDTYAWRDDALCPQTDPEAFFPEKGGSTREAKRVCWGCAVRAECLDYALTHDERHGIWGGLSERERRKKKRRKDKGEPEEEEMSAVEPIIGEVLACAGVDDAEELRAGFLKNPEKWKEFARLLVDAYVKTLKQHPRSNIEGRLRNYLVGDPVKYNNTRVRDRAESIREEQEGFRTYLSETPGIIEVCIRAMAAGKTSAK